MVRVFITGSISEFQGEISPLFALIQSLPRLSERVVEQQLTVPSPPLKAVNVLLFTVQARMSQHLTRLSLSHLQRQLRATLILTLPLILNQRVETEAM